MFLVVLAILKTDDMVFFLPRRARASHLIFCRAVLAHNVEV